MCLEDDCQTPEQQYPRRSDWINHMRQAHWRFWTCPFGCQDKFSTANDFDRHVKQTHQTHSTVEDIDTLEELSSHASIDKVKGQCSLCQDFVIISERQYSSHISGHLESLALFALPGIGVDEDEDEEDESGKEGWFVKVEDLYESDSDVEFSGKFGIKLLHDGASHSPR